MSFEDDRKNVCFFLKRVDNHLSVLTKSDIRIFALKNIMQSIMWINDEWGLARMQVD